MTTADASSGASPAAAVDAPLKQAKPKAARPPSHPSLVRRLVVLHAILSIVVLATGGVALSAFFRQEATSRFDDRLSQDILDLVTGASVDDTGQVVGPALTDERTERAYSGKYWEMATPAAGGGVKALPGDRSRSLWDSPGIAAPPDGAGVLAATPGKPVFYNSVGPVKEPLRVAAEQVRLTGVASPIVFIVAEDRSPIDTDIRTFETATGLSLLVLAAMLIGGVMLQVRVGLQPLFALRREVAAVRTGKTDRLVGAYPAELEPLASELNALVAHNQEVVERQRTHVGNLAHALKTPLTVVTAEALATPGALADVVRRQADLMRQQVDHHLRRARAAARPQGGGERTEVAPVLEELALTLERIFRDKDVEIDWRAPDGLFFHGERQDLQELAGNVLENACKWCKGRVRADARTSGIKDLILTVEDDGPGLPPKDREEVLRRGARLDESEPGSGLGLSIADELARAYGGAITLADSALGGLKVELTLPRSEG